MQEPHLDAFYAQIGQQIRLLREKRGLTQDALASLMSLTRASIANIERGKQRMLAHSLVELASALGVTVADLLPSPTESSVELSAAVQARPFDEQAFILTTLNAIQWEVIA